MKKIILVSCFFLVALLAGAQNTSIPHLEKKNNTTQLIVKGKPFLMLGGELHNSSTSAAAYMRPIWERMAKKNLNTVLAPVYWELLEPKEGQFDFNLVDSMLLGARQQHLHLVILWFASWKNGYSMYAPDWVKNNTAKYPRAKDQQGSTIQHLSTFGQATVQADAHAFRALMKHIREVDAQEQTVVMAQIENEVGLFYTPRDHSEAANKAYSSSIPKELAAYLSKNKGKLQPELDSVWRANGAKTTGNWEEVFGKSIVDKKNWKTLSYLTEELFTVYQYAKYMGAVAEAGKEEYPIPMYVNAWIKQPSGGIPGKYPSGGPTPHTLDIWRVAAPRIDMIVPDIYVPDARYTISQYDRPGNPFLIPEIRPGLRSASEAFWAFGQYPILGFSPFGIDDAKPEEDPITKTYAALSQVQHLILEHQGKATMAGILVDTVHRSQDITMGGYAIKANLAVIYNFSNIEAPKILPGAAVAGGLLFWVGPDEFIAVGKDYTLTFRPEKSVDADVLLDVDYLDEGTFQDGKWVRTRRLNGDEGTGGGDYGFGMGSKQLSASLRFQQSPTGEYSIVRYKIYRYK